MKQRFIIVSSQPAVVPQDTIYNAYLAQPHGDCLVRLDADLSGQGGFLLRSGSLYIIRPPFSVWAFSESSMVRLVLLPLTASGEIPLRIT